MVIIDYNNNKIVCLWAIAIFYFNNNLQTKQDHFQKIIYLQLKNNNVKNYLKRARANVGVDIVDVELQLIKILKKMERIYY